MDDAATYERIVRPTIDAHPAVCIIHSSVIRQVQLDPPGYPEWKFFVVAPDSEHPFPAHWTPPYPLHMPVPDATAAQELADYVLEQEYTPSYVGGDPTSCKAFINRWSAVTGISARLTKNLGIFELPGRAELVDTVSGSHRWATPADEALVHQWCKQFTKDANTEFEYSLDRVRAALEHQEVLLWCDPDPVSMALYKVAGESRSNISQVFTPAASRGHGYASAVTCDLSNTLVDRGLKPMLYTDLTNPTSNKIYQAIGFRRVGDSVDYVIEYPTSSL